MHDSRIVWRAVSIFIKGESVYYDIGRIARGISEVVVIPRVREKAYYTARYHGVVFKYDISVPESAVVLTKTYKKV